MKPDLLTIPQFCKSINIGTTYAYQLINEGKIRAVKIGKKTLIPKEALDDFIADLEPYKAVEGER